MFSATAQTEAPAKARKLRPAVVIRIVGAIAFVLLLLADGAAIKAKVSEAPVSHYTVMLRSGANVDSVINTYGGHKGFTAEHAITDNGHAGFTASMTTSMEASLVADQNVSYVEEDNSVVSKNLSWWDTLLQQVNL